jgi:pimeloyl-ACP methyl ester carboxylesterase
MTIIAPFRVNVSDDDLKDLRERLARTRWPDPETVPDWSQGIPLDYVRELCEYWATGYDWRRVEARLNSFDQVLITLDGVDIHAIHAPSPEPNARPLIMTHGWPGSIVEFLDVIEPLRNPAAHGGDPADAFHVVVPSLPGYGFSGKPTTAGWSVKKTAAEWCNLMKALGYPRFLAQGGDWGSLVTTVLGTFHSGDGVDGIHINFALAKPDDLMALGEPTPAEMADLGKMGTYVEQENGYSQQQATRPQTLGYGLADSPAGQCAWILEKFKAWSGVDHPEEAFSRDHLLDNISVYWLTNTGASSARLYWESMAMVFTFFDECPAPSAYSNFPHDVMTISERWARTRYTDLRYFNQLETGGHFAAMQLPDVFVTEVRNGLRSMR